MTAISPAATKAVENVRRDMDTTGIFNTVTKAEARAVMKTLSQLSPEDAKAVINRLSPDEMDAIADEVSEMSADERQGFFADMAKVLGDGNSKNPGGAALAKLAHAFDRTEGSRSGGISREDSLRHTEELGAAIAQHSSDRTKVDLVGKLAPETTDQKAFPTHVHGGVHYDPQARLVAQVIGGIKDKSAAQSALGGLESDQLKAVINAGAKPSSSVMAGALFGSTSNHVETKTLEKLLDVAAGVPDAKIKAAVFANASKVLEETIDQARHPGVGEPIREGMSKLLLSDTNGIIRDLQSRGGTMDGTPLASYMKASINAGDTATIRQIQERIAYGENNRLDPNRPGDAKKMREIQAQRFSKPEKDPHGRIVYPNAATAGYFAGAVGSAVKSITSDRKAQEEILTAVLKTALTVADKSDIGVKTFGKLTAGSFWGGLKESVGFGTKGSGSELSELEKKLYFSMLPIVQRGTLPNGEPDLHLSADQGAQGAYDGSAARVRNNAAPR